MKLTAKTMSDGTVEFFAGGKPIEGMRCKPHTARVSGDQIEVTAYVTCDRQTDQPVAKSKKEKPDAVDLADQG